MNSPIDQIPDFETCLLLEKAGLKPPLGQSVGYCYEISTDEEVEQKFALSMSGFFDVNGTRFQHPEYGFVLLYKPSPYIKMRLLYAPTSGQLLGLLLELDTLPARIPKKDRANFLAKAFLTAIT
jgi:hypothetical protein